MRLLTTIAVLLITLLTGAGGAAAQSCTATVGDVNFGSVDLLAGVLITTSSSLSVTCSGAANATALACPRFSQGSGGGSGDIRTMTNGGSGVVNFNVFRNSGLAQVWGGTFGSTTAPTIPVALDGNGNGSVSGVIVYGAIYAGQNLAFTGSYVSNIVISTQSGYDGGSCGTGATTAGAFNVAASYSPTCTLSTGTLDFGGITTLNAAVDGQTNLNVACSNGSDYSVALDGGQTNASDPEARKMSRASHLLTYGLYRDSNRQQPWGSTAGAGGNVLGSTGTGAAQLHPVYGRIPPQPIPPIGTYTDLIVVTVTH